MLTVGTVLKIMRERRNLTLKEMVDLVPRDKLGAPMADTTISRAENDDPRISPDTISRIAQVFGTDAEHLRRLVDRLNAAWGAPDIDVQRDLEDAAFWADYKRLDPADRAVARIMMDALLRRTETRGTNNHTRGGEPP